MRVVDLSDYFRIREQMRLLPNLLDFSLAYSLYRPMLQIKKNATLLAQLSSGRKNVPLLDSVGADVSAFFLAVGAYLLYTLIYLTVSILLYAKLKDLVRSDSRRTVLVIGALAGLMSYVWLTSLPADVRWVAAVPGVLVYAAAKFLFYLSRIEGHPTYHHLARISRRSYAFASSRYALFSWEDLRIKVQLLGSFWKAYIGYFALGAALIAVALITELPAVRSLTGPLQLLPIPVMVLGVIAMVYVLGRPLLTMQRRVSNQIARFLTELRTRLARTASEVAQSDTRPAILFLRSFQDDKLMVENDRFWGSRYLGLRDDSVRLEEVIAESLYPYGPLIALSNPQDKLPLLGAAKENVADDRWRDAIAAYIGQAQRIVLILGSTPNLLWEIQLIATAGMSHKCIFVFPPDLRADSALREVLQAFPVLADTWTEVGAGALVFSADPIDPVLVTSAAGRKKYQYAEALHFACRATVSREPLSAVA